MKGIYSIVSFKKSIDSLCFAKGQLKPQTLHWMIRVCPREKYTEWPCGKKLFKWLRTSWIEIKVFMSFNCHKIFIGRNFCLNYRDLF